MNKIAESPKSESELRTVRPLKWEELLYEIPEIHEKIRSMLNSQEFLLETQRDTKKLLEAMERKFTDTVTAAYAEGYKEGQLNPDHTYDEGYEDGFRMGKTD